MNFLLIVLTIGFFTCVFLEIDRLQKYVWPSLHYRRTLNKCLKRERTIVAIWKGELERFPEQLSYIKQWTQNELAKEVYKLYKATGNDDIINVGQGRYYRIYRSKSFVRLQVNEKINIGDQTPTLHDRVELTYSDNQSIKSPTAAIGEEKRLQKQQEIAKSIPLEV